MTPIATSAPPRCDATNTKVGWTEWGTRGIPCQAGVGLRSFIDRQGVTRYYCPALGHKHNVERRYGKLGACFLCGRLDRIELGLYTRVWVGEDVALLCDICREKGDEE